MIEIELKYNNESETIGFPQTWNELTVPQLLYIANLWEAWQLMARGNVNLLKAKALLFLELLNGNTKNNRADRAKKIALLSEDDQTDLIQCVNFIFESNKLTVCPLPWVKVGMRKYYAPNNGLSNIKAIEWHFADKLYMDYYHTGEEKHLDNFIACLYRPSVSVFDKSGVRRVKFNWNYIEKYAKQIKRLSYSEKHLVLLWYIGSRDAFIKKYPNVFSDSNKKAAIENGWLKLILALSGNKFGEFEQTGQTDFTMIVMELEEMKERQSQNETDK